MFEIIFYFVLLAIFILFFVFLNRTLKKDKKYADEWSKKLQEHKKMHNVPADAFNITLYSDFTKEYGTRSYLWFDRDLLKILPYEFLGGNLISIDLRNINYFTQKGDFYTETSISGGGGGGRSVKGAVIGGIIAGGAGAVIGSRKKTEPIKTENHVVDKRKTIIEYRSVNNPKNYIFLDSDAYNYLMQMIPEKERDLRY
jgi:hypothetical protein